MSDAAKRIAMFARGAEAVRRIDSSITKPVYFCPICEVGFGQDDAASGELTVEHALPEERGGRGILLTCKSCNSFGGHELDVHGISRERIIGFGQGLLGGVGLQGARIRTNVGGENIAAELNTGPGGELLIEAVPEANSPEAIECTRASLENAVSSGSWDGHEFKITPQIRWHPRKASIGDLRAAYLLGFALFGYRYAFHPNLDGVRRQIREPEVTIVPLFSLKPKEPLGSPGTLLVAQEPFEALVVLLERELIVLPGTDKEYDVYGAFMKRSQENPDVSFRGEQYEAPQSLLMALDSDLDL